MGTGNIYDSDNCRLPSVKEVALRALCLGAVVLRAEFEIALMEDPSGEESENNRNGIERISSWVDEQGLSEHLTPEELVLITQPPGMWSEEEAMEVSWRLESLAVLLWSLGMIPKMPEWDEPISIEDIMPKLHIGGSIKKFHLAAKLKPQKDLMAYREIGDLWHWRIQSAFIECGENALEKGCELPEKVPEMAKKALEKGLISEVKEGDFVAFGQPVFQLGEDEFTMLTSMTAKRHYAIQWVTGACGEWMSAENN